MTLEVTLDQLCLSPFNVRTNPQDTEETGSLEASIAARGQIHPLQVHDMQPFRAIAVPGEPRAAWGVFAGGRRLRAMRRLLADGRVARDFLVKVDLRDCDPPEIIELSLAENLPGRDLRPYEIDAAIRDAVARGATDEEIAANLGQRLEWVQRHLRLGRLVPEIFDAYACGTIDADQAQAFAATEDEELQRAAWAHFSVLQTWDRAAHRIRAWYKLGDRELQRLLRFVGADAYRAAGGRFELDLFADGPAGSEWERGRIVDEGTLRELAENNLAAVRMDLRRRTGWSDLRFVAEPPQQHGGPDLSLLADVRLGKAAKIILPANATGADLVATIDIDAAGKMDIRYWWVSRKARREAMREAAGTENAGATASPPRTSFGHAIEGAEAFDQYSTYAQGARAAVKDEHGLTADGLQVLRSLRREVLRALFVTDVLGGGSMGRDYLVWAQLRQELGTATRQADIGARGLVSVGYGAEEREPDDVVAPHLEQSRAHEIWTATLDHLRGLPFMTIDDPAEAFAAFHLEGDRVKNVAAAVLAGFSLLRSANVPGWRIATHDRIAELLGAGDGAIRELWQPTPQFMALLPKLKRLELAQPHVDPDAFRSWHKQSDQILTGACAGALEQAQGWVHPLLSFGVQTAEPAVEQREAAA